MVAGAARMVCRIAGLLLLPLLLQLTAGVNTVYDVTVWTKRDWTKYRVQYPFDFNPSDGFNDIKSPLSSADIRTALASSSSNSIDGPRDRRSKSLLPSFWGASGADLRALDDADSIDLAATAVQCTVCHSLLSLTWRKVVEVVDSPSEPLTELGVRDLLDDVCEGAVADAVLSRYALRGVEAPASGALLYAVTSRKAGGAPPTPTEVAAVSKACQDLLAVHSPALGAHLWRAAKDYHAAARDAAKSYVTTLMRSALAASADDDEYEDEDDTPPGLTASGGSSSSSSSSSKQPDPGLCADTELMCRAWAQRGECAANPLYMVGSAAKPGHCRASCKACIPDPTWRTHPPTMTALSATATSLGAKVRPAACAATGTCLPGSEIMPGAGAGAGSGPTAGQAALITPGAALAAIPGFVLGKPFWGVPRVRRHAEGEAAGVGSPAPTALEEALSAANLTGAVLSMPGMDGFFMYEYAWKRRVYQYHANEVGKVTEEYTLGTYDAPATNKAQAADNATAVAAAAAAADKAAKEAAKKATEQQQQQQQRKAGDVGGKEPAKDTGSSSNSGGGTTGTAAAAGPPPVPQASSKLALAPATPPPTNSSNSTYPSPAAPTLAALDLLPDRPAMLQKSWPFLRQHYSGGDECREGAKRAPRQAEVRLACSPDTQLHMLVREPQFCSYIVVVYLPQLCPFLAPHPTPPAPAAAEETGVAAAAAAAAAAGGQMPAHWQQQVAAAAASIQEQRDKAKHSRPKDKQQQQQQQQGEAKKA